MVATDRDSQTTLVARDRHPFRPGQNLRSSGTYPPARFLVSVASKGLRVCVSGLESTLAGTSVSVDSKWVGVGDAHGVVCGVGGGG